MLTIVAVLAASFALAVAARSVATGLGWGPGVHIQATLQVLDHVRDRRTPTPEHRLILAHTGAFLYGNVAADLINFKKFGGAKNNCHNWNIHERLLACAGTDIERAFIFGYLCHLAADVVSHNHFIPYHWVKDMPPVLFGHAYWEALADGDVSDEEWDVLAQLRHNKALHRNDRLIWDAVRWRALGPRSNKWIFNNILLLNLRTSWRDLIRIARVRRSRHPIDTGFFRHCRARCIRDMLGVFDEVRLAALKLRDPTGRAALAGARTLRRRLLAKYGRTEVGRKVSKRIAREAYWVF